MFSDGQNQKCYKSGGERKEKCGVSNWITAKLHQMVKEEINAGKKIVVCPYGEWGMFLTDILDKAYGIKNTLVLDNGLSKYNSNIHSVDYLKKCNTESLTLILTSISAKSSREIQNQIEALGIDICVRNILELEIEESPYKESYFRELKKLLCCKKVEGKELIRVGSSKGDGGYIMAADFDNRMCAYSCGVGNDVSWDLDIANRGMKVFMYDHTIYHLPEVHNNFTFCNFGIGKGRNCVPLREILEKNNDLDNHGLILKMDIEGAEWEVLDDISSDLLNNFKQISLELHDVCEWERREEILKVLRKVIMTHQAIWVHGNNAGRAEIANGILMPNLIEVTFIRKESYSFINEECRFPMSLDLPNLKYRSDFELGNWGAEV